MTQRILTLHTAHSYKAQHRAKPERTYATITRLATKVWAAITALFTDAATRKATT